MAKNQVQQICDEAFANLRFGQTEEEYMRNLEREAMLDHGYNIFDVAMQEQEYPDANDDQELQPRSMERTDLAKDLLAEQLL